MNRFDNFDLDLSKSLGFSPRAGEDESLNSCVSGGSSSDFWTWTDAFDTLLCSEHSSCECGGNVDK